MHFCILPKHTLQSWMGLCFVEHDGRPVGDGGGSTGDRRECEAHTATNHTVCDLLQADPWLQAAVYRGPVHAHQRWVTPSGYSHTGHMTGPHGHMTSSAGHMTGPHVHMTSSAGHMTCRRLHNFLGHMTSPVCHMTFSLGSHDIFSRSHDISSRSHDISSRSHDISSRSHDISSRSHDISSMLHGFSRGSHDIFSRSHDISSRSHDISKKSHVPASWMFTQCLCVLEAQLEPSLLCKEPTYSESTSMFQLPYPYTINVKFGVLAKV